MTTWLYCPECKAEMVDKIGQTGECFPTCPNGHYTHYGNPDVAAGGIVEQEGKYLALKRNINPEKGKWEIPGGFVKAGDTAEKTFIREVKEETGLDVTIVGFVTSAAGEYGDTGISTLNIGFHGVVTGGDFALSDESQDFVWAGLDDLPPMALDGDRAIVKAFIAQQKGD